ncbi:MAG: hypothetical protein K5696_01895 [Lachnospiraceae bacterium]|nr:hypothetical protein [Lachnospiraceae bacterium]
MSARVCVSVETPGQLEAVLDAGKMPERLYLPLSAFLSGAGRNSEGWNQELPRLSRVEKTELFAALPYVLREEQGKQGLSDITEVLLLERESGLPVRGALARNLEELAYLRDAGYPGTLEADYTVPIWNAAALAEASALFDEWTLSPELDWHEMEELLREAALSDGENPQRHAALVVYGRVPMMVSAGCVRKTAGVCRGTEREVRHTEVLRDRKGKLLTVTTDCRACYNVIRNAVPTSLHRYRKEAERLAVGRFRIDLTVESSEEAAAVLAGRYPGETTAGRFKDGVE